VELNGLQGRLGQQYGSSPSVFSFYLPDYQPDGTNIGDAGLVSPEAQLSTPPYNLNFLNGITALIRWGLGQCAGEDLYHGFGTCLGDCKSPWRCRLSHRRRRRSHRNAAEYAETIKHQIQGQLSWTPEANSTAREVVDQLSLLLTQGRLNTAATANVVKAYEAAANYSGLESDGVKMAQMLIAVDPTFHATPENMLMPSTRSKPTITPSKGRPYKAVVVVFLHGGIDSFNLLVPHSQCTSNNGKDMYAEYAAVRTNVALAKGDLLQVDEPTAKQPCAKFGLHPMLKEVHAMYRAGEAAWLANIGPLVAPITKQQYKAKSVPRPPSHYAHNFAQRHAHNVHAQFKTAQGVAGRMMKALESQSNTFNGGLYSVNGNTKILSGGKHMADVVGSGGVIQYAGGSFNGMTEGQITQMLTQNHSTSLFVNTYVDLMESGLHRSKVLGDELKKVENAPTQVFPTSRLGQQLSQVARIMKASKALQNERAVFFTQTGGFDTHKDLGKTLETQLPGIDGAIRAFQKEMTEQGKWDDVVVLTMSDFGRTLTSNGRGTDHAWGGNMMMMGGRVNGGRIHGEFPDDLTSSGPLNVGRGRLIPTRGWESLWHGISEWMGVEADEMDTVLPNKKNFPDDKLFTKKDLFKI